MNEVGTNPRCRDKPAEGLLEGIELFNAGEYFECHEVLEDIWRAEADPVRALYQGILQIGVAFHHLRRGNWRGAVKLLDGGSEKVGRFLPRCMGVETAPLHASALTCLTLLRDLGPERVDEFDWSLIPTIEVATDQDR
jgi:predicted metal-dependent hydrolase